MKRFPNPFNYSIIIAGLFVLLLIPTTVYAFDFNPLHWVNQGIQGVINTAVGAGFVALIAWLGKGKWDAAILKVAIWNIKQEVDQFRQATNQASPGGTRITGTEWGQLAGTTLTNVLGILRGINPSWLPHI